jgi:acyl-[acyl-carrier-protein]-phospholipid O-acyltransferase/long-chain-fatty-acid--[acyl-carrier-protein] ligase
LNSSFLIITAFCLLAITLNFARIHPEKFIRILNWLLIHTVYRVRVISAHNIPQTGGALLVCNHVSFADPPLLLGAVKRPIRFLMYKPIYQHKFINYFARNLKAIPISQDDKPKEILKSLVEAREAVKAGELVCIFAEGSITRLGNLLPFARGLEQIMKGVSAPIIPIYLDQVWGSIFSFKGGKFFWKMPREIPYPVTVLCGAALPAATSAHDVRSAVLELGAEAFRIRRSDFKLLHRGFLHSVRRTPFCEALVDSTGRSLNYIEAATASICLAGQLARITKSKKNIGVLLPPSIGSALSNISISMLGKVSVNLNYTAGKESIQSAIKQAEITRTITSRHFLDKAKLDIPEGAVFIEDLLGLQGALKKSLVYLAVIALPVSLLARLFCASGIDIDQPATIIFSSGSTGEPKGVVLSHGNICSNVEGLMYLMQIGPHDGVLGVLPLFHSFGFTGTLWFPLFCGSKIAFHPNPLDSGVVGELVKDHKLSVLISTPTFLTAYTRRCTAGEFKTLKYVIVGAEKLKSSISKSFSDKFGVSPLEGYGATELSPVAMLNVPNYNRESGKQIGNKPGTVGHPIPGVTARVVNPDTFAPLGADQEGLLLIKGPNVMSGYLNNSSKTSEVMHNGWYITGDIAVIDQDGFVTIRDRLSRFSKIGGEMVPHVKIEEEIQSILGGIELACAVTSLPDEKKGEKLVVLLAKDFEVSKIIEGLSQRGLPNLWIPKKENFIRVGAIPMLGSGKMDLKGVKNIAKENLNQESLEGDLTSLSSTLP